MLLSISIKYLICNFCQINFFYGFLSQFLTKMAIFLGIFSIVFHMHYAARSLIMLRTALSNNSFAYLSIPSWFPGLFVFSKTVPFIAPYAKLSSILILKANSPFDRKKSKTLMSKMLPKIGSKSVSMSNEKVIVNAWMLFMLFPDMSDMLCSLCNG